MGVNPVPPYAGQDQQQVINVPAPISYIEPEEGPWAMMPYAYLYPQETVAPVPPPVQTTDLWSAQQTWPL